MSRGLFITFEGSEGCGKSTQMAELRQRLETCGQRFLFVREPGGTAIGERVRELLQYSPEGHALVPEAELLLFIASRAQLVREVIRPALAEGVHVVADRFYDSTTVYQGFGRGLDLLEVSRLNDFAIGSTHPDVTFLLDMDPAEASARAAQRSVEARPDRMEQQPVEFYERVRRGYLQLAREEPSRIQILDAARPAADLAEDIWNEIQKRLAKVPQVEA